MGWGANETPVVPKGLQVRALAKDFSHPRSLYVLPNGDVLVVESNGPEAPIHRPKDFVMGWVESKAGARGPSANRITLIREAKAGRLRRAHDFSGQSPLTVRDCVGGE